MKRIAIIGGGIAGLACAFALLRHGARVTVFEAQDAGRGALWASGGMLAPGFESTIEAGPHPEMTSLLVRSGRMWLDWAPAIERAGGMDIHHEARGSLTPAITPAERVTLEAGLQRAAAAGIEARWLEPAELEQIEPARLACHGAVHFPGDGQIDNRLLGPALLRAVLASGGQVQQGCPVLELVAGADGGIGVCLTGADRVVFDQAVLATGSGYGASPIAGLEGLVPDIMPVKGQMLAFAVDRAQAPFHLVRGLSIYLATKPGGRVIAGATSEPGRSDALTEPATIAALAARARSLMPSLRAAPVVEQWAGLRPAAPDMLPVLGASRLPGLSLALGGYRNGVLLAPAMAEAVANQILAGRLPDWARAFGAARFRHG